VRFQPINLHLKVSQTASRLITATDANRQWDVLAPPLLEVRSGAGPTPMAQVMTEGALGGVPRGSAACAASAQESPDFRQGTGESCVAATMERRPAIE